MLVDRKTGLVALREFHENVRTKTFWIGIFFFPIVLILSIVVPRFLENSKDARSYAVLDESGWLGAEITKRSRLPDIEKLFRDIRDRSRRGVAQHESAQLNPEFVAKIAELDDEEIANSAQVMTGLLAGDSLLEELDEVAPDLAENLRASREQIENFLRSIDQGGARDIGDGLDLGKFRRLEFPGATEDSLRAELARDEIFAYFVVPTDPAAVDARFKYVSNNLTDEDLKRWFGRYATEAVRERRFADAGIDRGLIERIQRPVVFESKQVDSRGEEQLVTSTNRALQWMPMAFVYLLWISTFMISQMLLTNTIEEKSNRTIEVLLSSVTPIQLMSGKILGIALTGVTVVVSWIFFFFAIIQAASGLGFDPPFDPTPLISNPKYLASFVVYFLLGYLMFASLLVGIGSACNSLKEAQNLMMPVSVIMMVPLFTMFPIVQDPNGTLAKVMTYIPLTTPFAMMNRSAAEIPAWEYAATTILSLATIAFLFHAAGRIFRVGILMTGKPPRLREILKWVRAD